jgi:hypothetical protein
MLLPDGGGTTGEKRPPALNLIRSMLYYYLIKEKRGEKIGRRLRIL